LLFRLKILFQTIPCVLEAASSPTAAGAEEGRGCGLIDWMMAGSAGFTMSPVASKRCSTVPSSKSPFAFRREGLEVTVVAKGKTRSGALDGLD
jgi:hypothetical protein